MSFVLVFVLVLTAVARDTLVLAVLTPTSCPSLVDSSCSCVEATACSSAFT